MQTSVRRLKNFSYAGTTFDTVYIILDKHGCPPLLPLLYTLHMCQFGWAYQERDLTDESSGARLLCMTRNEISENTIRAYVYNLAAFLDYLEASTDVPGIPSIHSSANCDEKFVNNYLNSILCERLSSPVSLDNHRSALTAYFAWLDYMELAPRLNLAILRKTRQTIHEKSNRHHYIQYLSRSQRCQLLNACASMCEKLIMRMGYEVGLRTSEVSGLELHGPKGLFGIFEEVDDPDLVHIDRFKYLLQGKYTKGGRSRWIYFDRDLIYDLKRYVSTERTWLLDSIGCKINPKMLFLRTDKRFCGTPIGKEQASRVFRIRAKQAGLHPFYHFHDLRHTFATELFHEELSGITGRETRSESAALIVVAQRLGHSFNKSGQAPSTTTRYIRMRIQMIELEGKGVARGNN